MKKKYNMKMLRGCVLTCNYNAKYKKEMLNFIDELESHYPVERWIPCSEQLPKLGQACLVSICVEKVYQIDDICLDETEEWVDIGVYWEDAWSVSSEDEQVKAHNVIAWRPLPNVYREERE